MIFPSMSPVCLHSNRNTWDHAVETAEADQFRILLFPDNDVCHKALGMKPFTAVPELL